MAQAMAAATAEVAARTIGAAPRVVKRVASEVPILCTCGGVSGTRRGRVVGVSCACLVGSGR